MAITGTLNADFSAFDDAVSKSVANLAQLETQGDITAQAVGAVGSTFDGSKVVTEANEMAGAIKNVAGETAATTVQTGSLSSQYKQFDGVLSAAGINLNQQVKAIEDLGAAAKTGGAGLSAFSTAGLLVGAAMVGWQIGTKIDEWTGLSKAIGDATASALGWTTAAGGAGSATDTLARASKIAGREITDFNEATKIIRKGIDDMQAASMRAQGPAEMAKQMKVYYAEIKALGAAGVLDDLNRALERGIIPQQKLQEQYKVSSEAIKILNDQRAREKQHLDESNAAYDKFIALKAQLFGTDLIEKASEYARALGGVSNISKLLPEQMTALQTTFAAAADQLVRLGKAGSEAHTQFRNLAAATTPMPDLFKNLVVGTEGLADVGTKATINWNDEAKAINAANAALTEVAPVMQETTPEVEKQTTAVQQLAQAYTIVSKSAQEWRAQAAQLLADATRNEMAGGGLMHQQYALNQRAEAGRALASAGRQDLLDQRVAGMSAPWGRGGGWTVNVNAGMGTNGDQIANELVAGMRKRGISPGGF